MPKISLTEAARLETASASKKITTPKSSATTPLGSLNISNKTGAAKKTVNADQQRGIRRTMQEKQKKAFETINKDQQSGYKKTLYTNLGVNSDADYAKRLQTEYADEQDKQNVSGHYSALQNTKNIWKTGLANLDEGTYATLQAIEDKVLSPIAKAKGEDPLTYAAENGFFNKRYEKKKQEAAEAKKELDQNNMALTGRSRKVAEKVDQYLTEAVRTIPSSIVAIALAPETGGVSLTGLAGADMTTSALTKIAGDALNPGTITAAKNIIGGLAKNPGFWQSFVDVFGNKYENAVADGQDLDTAMIYAISSSLVESAIEVGGGIQQVPLRVENTPALKLLATTMWEEGVEEVTQGLEERGMQNIIYNKGNPLVSSTDPNAVINPAAAKEEFLGGAVIGGILGAANVAASNAIQSAETAKLNAYGKELLAANDGKLMANVVEMAKAVSGDTEVGVLAKKESLTPAEAVYLYTSMEQTANNLFKEAAVFALGGDAAVNSAVVAVQKEQESRGYVSAATLNQLRTSVEQAKSTASTSEERRTVAQEANPNSTIADDLTSQYTALGMSLKAATKKAEALTALLSGDTIDQSMVNVLALTGNKTRAIVEKATGVPFSEKASPENLRNWLVTAQKTYLESRTAAAETVGAEAQAISEETAANPIAETENAEYNTDTVNLGGRELTFEQAVPYMLQMPGMEQATNEELREVFNILRSQTEESGVEKGADNGRTGNLPAEGVQRIAGERTGGERGGVESASGSAEVSQGTRSSAADSRGTRGNAASSRNSLTREVDLGDGRVVNEYNTENYTGDWAAEREKFSRVGGRFSVVDSPIPMKNGGEADGLRIGDRAFVYSRGSFSVTELGDHEFTHYAFSRDPSLYALLRSELPESLFDFKNNETAIEYYENYAPAYKGVSDDALTHLIAQEMICDIYAGIERYADLSEYRDTVRETVDAWADQYAGNFGANDLTENPSIVSFGKAAGIEVSRDQDGKIQFTLDGKPIDKVNWKHIRDNSALGYLIQTAEENKVISADEVQKQCAGAASLMNLIMRTGDPDMVWAYVGASMFSAVKTNADGQYSTTIDFTTVCRKTQNMITAMSKVMKDTHRGLSKQQITELQAKLINNGSPVPCPVCYVFSRWAGIGQMLQNIYDWQNEYAEYTPKQLEDRIAELEKRAEETKADLRERLRATDDRYSELSALRELNSDDYAKSGRLMRAARDAGDTVTAERLKRHRDNIEMQQKTIKKELEQIEKDDSAELVWLKTVRTAENYKAVPADILFDLDAGKEFASKEYAATWKYRTTRGPAAGKAIVPYADMRVGDLILGPGKNSAEGKKAFDNAGKKTTKTMRNAVLRAVARAKAQNLIGGQRYQSTSDFRYEYALDYVQSFFEAQAIGLKLQTYTKVIEYADLIASVGGDVNLSVMPRNAGYKVLPDGTTVLDFSSVTGIDYDTAVQSSEMYDNVQLILVGISDKHIETALADKTIGFVIPYHASGASADFIWELVKNLGEVNATKNYQDYAKVQTDTARTDATPTRQYRSTLRGASLTGKISEVNATKNYQDYAKVQTDTARTDATPTQQYRSTLRGAILTGKISEVNEETGKKKSVSWTLSEEDAESINDESVDILGKSFADLRKVEEKALVDKDPAAIAEYESWTAGNLKKLYDRLWRDKSNKDEYGVRLTASQAKTIMPHEYWDKRTTVDNAYINGFLFRSYCYNLGLNPRFTGWSSSGKVDFGDFSALEGYWKTLIDRPMYANDGSYREQQKINLTEFNPYAVKEEFGRSMWGDAVIPSPDASLAIKAAEQYEIENPSIAISPEDAAKQIKEQQREIARIQKELDYWKAQTKTTKEQTLRVGDVRAFTRKLLYAYNSNTRFADIEQPMLDLGKYLLNEEELYYGDLREMARPIAEEIIENAKQETTDAGELILAAQKDIRTLKDGIRFTDTADITDYSEFQRRHRSMNLSKTNGTPVDVLYETLTDRYGSLFPSDIVNPADQVQRIAEVMDMGADEIYMNPYAAYKAYAVDEVTTRIIDGLLSEEVRQNPKTYADRMRDRIDAVRAAERQKAAAEKKQIRAEAAEDKKNALAYAEYEKQEALKELRRKKNERLDAALAEAMEEKQRAVKRAAAKARFIGAENTKAMEVEQKKAAAKRLNTVATAYAALKENVKNRNILRRNAAKALSKDQRLVEKKRAEKNKEYGYVNTIPNDPQGTKRAEQIQAAANKLRTLYRGTMRNFVSQTYDVERLAERQIGNSRADTYTLTLRASESTIENLFKDGLVDTAGNRIGDSLKDTVLFWSGKRKVDTEKQIKFNDYLLHKHNIDRMSFEAKALSKLVRYETENAWVAEMGVDELARLVALTDTEAKNLGKEQARSLALGYASVLREYAEAKNKPVFYVDEDGNLIHDAENGTPVTAEDSQRMVDRYEEENPDFKEKADALYKWWDAFMRSWVVGTSITQEQYDTMREMYPHYVPTYREDKGIGSAVSKSAKGITPGTVVKKAIGSAKAIVPVEDSFAAMAAKAVSTYRANELLRNMIDTAMLDENGTFSDMLFFDWEDMLQDTDSYVDPNGETVFVYKNGFDMADQIDSAMLPGVVKTKDGTRYISAWYDGKLRRAMVVDEGLFKSISNAVVGGMDEKLRGLIKAGNILTGPMKFAITGINPAFAARNVERDLPTAVVNSISGLQFGEYWAKAAVEMAKNTEKWQQFQALGGTNSGYYNQNKGFQTEMTERHIVKDTLEHTIGAFNEWSEAQTRFAEYLATIDKLGDTYENRLLGIKNAAEVTVDFSRHGEYGTLINAWVPYWNPQVQGIDKVIRTAVSTQEGTRLWNTTAKQAVSRLGSLGARYFMTTILAEAIQYAILKALGRYDDWDELDDRTKAAYYCFPNPFNPDDPHDFLKIPKNREIGALIGVPFMHLLEYLNGREDPFENYLEVSINPNFLPGAILRYNNGTVESDVIGISQGIALATNRDFAGRRIVDSDLENGSLEMQYDEDTSVVSRKLGELIHFSPKQLDYLIKDYLGDFGKVFVNLTSPASDGITISGVWNSIVDLSTADNRYSNYSVSKYYDVLDELNDVIGDKRNHESDEIAESSIEYKTLQAMNTLYGKQITALNKTVRELEDGEEKDNAKAQIATLAKQALQFYEQSMSGEIEEPILTAKYSMLPESLSDTLIELDEYNERYQFAYNTNTTGSYVDPEDSEKKYVLTEEQKAKNNELRLQYYIEYASALKNTNKFKKASAEEKAKMLGEAKDDAYDEAKDEFMAWLKKNSKSVPRW